MSAGHAASLPTGAARSAVPWPKRRHDHRHPCSASAWLPLSETWTFMDSPQMTRSVPASLRGVSLVRLGRTSQRPPLHRRVPSRPTGGRLLRKPSQRSKVACSIHISVDGETTLKVVGVVADVDALGEVHVFFDIATPRTLFGGREPTICQQHLFPLPDGLVAHLSLELSKAHVADSERQLAVALHALHIEIL